MTTTAMRPMTAYSEYRRMMTSTEQVDMVSTLKIRNVWVIPHGTVHCC